MFKKRIGITQRVMRHPHYNEVMDCLDINWTNLLISLNMLPVPLPLIISPELVPSVWKMFALDGLILSGGNTLVDFADDSDLEENLSLARDAYEKALLDVALSTQVPILGICRGLQMINVYYGGGLVKVKGHSGARHSLVASAAREIFECPVDVNSFHDCAVPADALGNGLIALAHDKDGNIEAFCHAYHKVFAIMWHPERENQPTESDCKLIKGLF